MTFDEWWETLTTREQNSSDRDLTKAAWQVSAMLMQERCAKWLDSYDGPVNARRAEAIRALENE